MNNNKKDPYKCNKCDKTFSDKYNFDRHNSRKNPCVKPSVYICEFCNKKLSNKQSVIRHQEKSCKKIQKDNKNIHDTNANTLNNTQNMHYNKGTINVNNTTNNITNNITNNNNNITNNNINVIVSPYGDEQHVDEIPDTLYRSFICKGGGHDTFISLIKHIHFNELFSTNHNLLVTNLQNKWIQVYGNENGWEFVPRKGFIQKLISDKQQLIDNVKDKIIKNKRISLRYDVYIEKLYSNIATMNTLCTNIECLMFNNKELPLKLKQEWLKANKH